MKRIFFLVAGMLFFTAAAGVIPGRLALVALAADKELVDINSASEKELGDLKGINKEEAKKIVKGRPYARKDELLTKKILSEKDYDKIKDQIVAKQSAAKGGMVDINSASEKELADVHGIGVDEAKKIVKNRPYARKEDLVSKNILDERTYAKVKDKLVVGHGTAKDSTTSDMKSKVTGAIDSLTGKDKK